MKIELRSAFSAKFSLLEKNRWIHRYANIHEWRKRASILRTSLRIVELRKELIEKLDPVDQYRAMELLAKFNNTNTDDKIKNNFDKDSEYFVGHLFGDLLTHHVNSQDIVRRNAFILNNIPDFYQLVSQGI